MKMKELLKGIKTTVKAVIENPKLKTAWKGEIEFDWSDMTVEQVLTFATDNRKIAYASTARKDLATLKGVKVVKVKVQAPGTRTGVAKPTTLEDVEKYLATQSKEKVKELFDAATADAAIEALSEGDAA